MEELMKRAQADLHQTQEAIYETALPLYKKYFPNPNEAAMADKKKVTAAVLDKLAAEHPNDGTIVGYCQKVVGEATDFVKQRDLVTVPDKPLDVIVMPEFKRGTGIAYLRFARAAGKEWQNLFCGGTDAEGLAARHARSPFFENITIT